MVDIVDLWNQGLRAGGLPLRINDAYEGSDAARVMLELYSQTRDELLNVRDWSFNRHTMPMVLLKGPPPDGGYSPSQPWSNLYPAPGWLYEYDYPDDAINLTAVIPPPLGPMPDLDPKPAVWRVDNDSVPIINPGPPPTAIGPPAKVVYCNITDALATYRSRVTDPNLFDRGFTASLIEVLGKRAAASFGASPEVAKELLAEATATIAAQSDVRG